jgi:MFS family permease
VASDNVLMEDKEGAEIQRKSGRSLGQVLAAGVIALVVAMGVGRFAYTPILPAMQGRFDLSNAAAGALASSNYLGYLLGALLAAFVPTGRPQDAVLRTSLWTVAAATVLVGLTTDFSAWFALRFIAGLASAGGFVLAAAVVLEELSRRDTSGLSGVFFSGVGIGIMLSGLVVLPLNELLAGEPGVWRAGWLLLGTLALVLVIPCHAWLPREEAEYQDSGEGTWKGASPKKGSAGTGRCVASGATLAFALLCSAYFLEGAGYIVTGTFLPTIVDSLPGLGDLGAGVWILVGLAAAPSALLWAGAASRLRAPRALGAAYAAQAAGILLLVVSSTWWAAAASGMLLGGTFVGISALTLTYARQFVGGRRAGFAIGLLTAAYGVGQVVGPLVAARLADEAGHFGPALVVASGSVALGGLLMPAVGLVGGTNTAQGKGCVHDNEH